MADRAAAEKKQSGKTRTIRQALEAQGGGSWYAPKARPGRHHVWLRKGINANFAPFLSKEPLLIDQRCNSIAPISGVDWTELAAVLTTSLFAYSVEVNGAAGMGAGVLEARTTELSRYPVFDVRQLSVAQRASLVDLARAVWSEEAPVDWAALSDAPGARLRELDQWLLKASGTTVDLDRLYTDLGDVVRSRLVVAGDKVKASKKKRQDSIGSVAGSIAAAILPKLKIRNFPDDFAGGATLDLPMNFDRGSLKHATMVPLLGDHDLKLTGTGGNVVYEATLSRSVAEAIVRSLLWGRSIFSVSSDQGVMERAISSFVDWAGEIERDIERAIQESALGTGYESTLKARFMAGLA